MSQSFIGGEEANLPLDLYMKKFADFEASMKPANRDYLAENLQKARKHLEGLTQEQIDEICGKVQEQEKAEATGSEEGNAETQPTE